jgi:putative two-component system response regulator
LVKDREQAEYTYTILLTGKSGKEDVLDGFAAGADDYLTKKMDPEELRSRLNAGKRVVQYEERLREQEFQVRLKCYQALTELAEARDADTGSHLKRLSTLSVCLAERLGMPREFVKQLDLFAPMHDIGKVGIPDSILLAPRRLTEDEFKIMQSHSTLGWEILDGKPTLEMAADIAYTHHERWNGAGYPRGLSGDEIPLSGRIVAITDVYDALRSERPYKQGWSHEKTVLHIMKEAGQHFDPELTDVFWSERGRILDIFESLQDR